jgi:acyl transferase domain-containing protein
MLAVDLSEDEFDIYIQRLRSQSEIQGRINIACYNSPSNLTISGDQETIDRLKQLLDADHIVSHLLRTGIAYHSPQMNEIASLYRESLHDLSSAETLSKNVAMVSTVTGQDITDPSILKNADYWVNNMVNPVRFSEAITIIVSQNHKSSKIKKLGTPAKKTIFDLVEIGPHPVLQRPVRQILQANNLAPSTVRYSATLNRRSDTWQNFLSVLGNLHSHGYLLDLDKVNRIRESSTRTEMPLEVRRLLLELPEYPFNHSRRYWFETAASRNIRLPPSKKLELIGTPAPESTSLEAKWRKFFDVNETPWVEHHKVNGKIIYPATGMAIMAIEGARQLAASNQAIKGYFLKDATFTHPISINSANKTEVHLCMRPLRNVLEKSAPWYEFRIYTGTGDQQRENCRGTICIQYKNSSSNWTGVEKLDLEGAEHYRNLWSDAVKACSEHVPTDKMYQAFEDNGLNYGPSFQLLDNLAWDGKGGVRGDIKAFQWTSEQSQNGRQDHIVHPATLDAAGQLAWVALTKGAREVVVNGAAITRVQSAWISCSGLAYPETTTLKCCAQTRLKGLRGTETSLVMLDDENEVRLWIKNLETTSVSGNKPSVTSQTEHRRLCYSIESKPDFQFFSKEQLLSYCRPQNLSAEDPAAFYNDLEILLLYYVRTCLAGLESSEVQVLPKHLQKYVAWLRWQVQRYDSRAVSARCHDALDKSNDHEFAEAISEKIKNSSIEGKLFVTVGKHIQDIVNGSANPLEIIFRDGLVDNHYQIVCDTILCSKYLKKYLDVAAHKNPSMKILEVGAGTGSLTKHVLNAMTRDDDGKSARFLQYDYTDVSESFLENARTKFNAYGSRVQFKTFNVEIDPESQGYELESYDMIVAAWVSNPKVDSEHCHFSCLDIVAEFLKQVLHATRDLNTTVSNVKKLLKP